MLYVDDAGLYKDIEELIAMDAITLKGGADIGELQFRFVNLVSFFLLLIIFLIIYYFLIFIL